MRDPGLSSEQFTRDQVLTRETILSGEDLAGLLGAAFEDRELKLEASGRLSFSVQPPDPDLSHFNTICLEATNLSSNSLLAGARLSHFFPEDSLGPAHVSHSGGREELPLRACVELRFPRECFGIYGNPVGWSGIQEMEFTFCREKHLTGPENVSVSVRSIYGELRKIPQGPRLTTEALETVLKQDAWKAADIRSKSMGPTVPHAELRLLVPPPHPYPRESADEILQGRIMGQDLGRDIDWDANPLGLLEWTHFLNRHHFFRELVHAYIRSGDPRYAAELDRLVANWIRSNPVPVGSNGGAGPAWETLSVAWRLREWLFVTEHAWKSEAFRQSTKIEMLRSIWEHARSLTDHKGHPNNWIIVESVSLALTGLLFPEFEESDFWVRTGLERLQEESCRQFFRDGVHFEISPLYHAICFHSLLELKLACENSGVTLDQELGETLERCADYLAALCRPDFTWPSLNDSGSATQHYTALMLLAGRVFERPDLVWTGSRGSEGELPAGGPREFPEAGVAVMRSGYDSWANFLVFRAGPPGAAHIHEDVLSLDVCALGKPRLVDPGITTYGPDRLTEQYRSAFAHNTILVDGGGPALSRMEFRRKTRPAGGDFSLTHRNDMEIASGAFYGPWEHAEDVAVFRTVFFVRGKRWIVLDTAEGEGRHEITVCWQFAPGRVEMDLNTFGARSVDLQGANLEIIPLHGSNIPEIEVFTGSFRPPRGWVSVRGSDMPATSCAYHFSAQLPLSIVWILAPFSVGPTCGIEARRTENTDGSIAVELTLSDGQMERIDLFRG